MHIGPFDIHMYANSKAYTVCTESKRTLSYLQNKCRLYMYIAIITGDTCVAVSTGGKCIKMH